VNIKKIGTMVATASIASLVLTGLSVTAANAADPMPLNFYFADGGDGHILADGQVMNWEDQVLALPGTTEADLDTAFQGSADATGAMNFIAPIGKETQINQWIATGPQSFMPGTKNILQPNVSLTGFTNGNWAGVKAGGDYSIGFAWTINNGVGLATKGVLYRTIHVATGGAGKWTFDTQAPVQTGVAPAITTQPANQTVTAPATATFTVAASGTPVPTFKWQSSTDGTTWTDIAGATAATYTTPATAVADSGKKFRAIATNGTAPDATSNVATLTVNAPAPTEPTQPTGDAAGKVEIAAPAAGATSIKISAGATNAGKKYDAWAWSTPTKVGNQLTADQAGDVTVDITSLPAGEHTVALTEPSQLTVQAWGTFTKVAAADDPISKDVNLSAVVKASDLWSLTAAKTAIDFGTIERDKTSTQKLGKVTVLDDRTNVKGWNLTAAWAPFKSGTDEIAASALTLTPEKFAGSTLGAGVTLGTTPAAFASSTPVATLAGEGEFDANLVFHAPADAKAGTYTSKLTLTLTSK
jgi:hypothetical protein